MEADILTMGCKEYTDIFELLRDVKAYKLRENEALDCLNSCMGEFVGYTTADSDFPATQWKIPTKQAKYSAKLRYSKEGKSIQYLLSSYMGRKELLERVRRGAFKLVDPIYNPEELYSPEPETEPKGPRQCIIPGL